MRTVQPPARDALLDRVAGYTGGDQLSPRDHAVLPALECPDLARLNTFPLHEQKSVQNIQIRPPGR